MHNKLAKMLAVRDAVYVVAIFLVATALCTLLGTLGEIGNTLTTATICCPWDNPRVDLRHGQNRLSSD